MTTHTTADEAETITLRVPRGNDIENCLLDLDGIGALLLDMAAAVSTGMTPNRHTLYFLGASIAGRAKTLADDLGYGLFQKGGEDRP